MRKSRAAKWRVDRMPLRPPVHPTKVIAHMKHSDLYISFFLHAQSFSRFLSNCLRPVCTGSADASRHTKVIYVFLVNWLISYHPTLTIRIIPWNNPNCYIIYVIVFINLIERLVINLFTHSHAKLVHTEIYYCPTTFDLFVSHFFLATTGLRRRSY